MDFVCPLSLKWGEVRTTGAKEAEDRQYLTRGQVARLFEVSPATIARWTREGKLPFVLTPGGQRRYLRRQITALLLGQRGEGGGGDESHTA